MWRGRLARVLVLFVWRGHSCPRLAFIRVAFNPQGQKDHNGICSDYLHVTQCPSW